MTSKLERLLNLTAALLATTRPLTAEELRGRLDGYPEADASFRRAFERDKDDLRQMGIPIQVREVPHIDPPILGYVIDRGEYSGNDPRLAPEELAALHVAANLVRLGEPVEGALWKIGGLGASSAPEQPMVALSNDARLAPLFSAATELRVAHFRYREVDRSVEPSRLSFARGHWYLDAYDRTRGEQRRYRVDRIEGDVALGPPRAFTRPPQEGENPHLRSWELGEDEPTRVLVLIDADQAIFATHELGAGAVVEQRADGAVVFGLDVRNQPALRSFVLTFLEHAEVLAPQSARQMMRDWLLELAGDAS